MAADALTPPSPVPTNLHGAPGADSSEEPIWEREKPCGREWKPGLALLRALRDYQGARNFFSRGIATLRHRFWSAVAGCDIPLNSRIAGGFMIPHPNGVVIHPEAEIGTNVLIFQQVTIGAGGPIDGAPRICSGAMIGAGSKVLGGIRIGKNAKIGANAVVLQDIPDGGTAVGIPARIISCNY
jgi:serine O-acetyltransferase